VVCSPESNPQFDLAEKKRWCWYVQPVPKKIFVGVGKESHEIIFWNYNIQHISQTEIKQYKQFSGIQTLNLQYLACTLSASPKTDQNIWSKFGTSEAPKPNQLQKLRCFRLALRRSLEFLKPRKLLSLPIGLAIAIKLSTSSICMGHSET
jgi:hypothetical protein